VLTCSRGFFVKCQSMNGSALALRSVTSVAEAMWGSWGPWRKGRSAPEFQWEESSSPPTFLLSSPFSVLHQFNAPAMKVSSTV
jgi:hypothetical protein